MVDYGTEVSCITDIDAAGRMVSGFTVVAEAIMRRLTTPRGRLIGDPDYGFDLTDYVNADMSPRDIAGLRAGVQAECEKDERVERAQCTAVLGSDGVLTITIVIDLSTESFTLVVAASAAAVAIVSVQ